MAKLKLNRIYIGKAWRSARTFSEDTVFGEKDSVSLDYTLEKEALRKTTRNEGGWSLVSVKSTSTSTNSSNNVHVGAVCSLQDSPYRIFKAAESGNLEEFRRLYLADTSRLEYQDAKGKAAIHYAATKNHTEIIWFIKERGGDLNMRDFNGNTALHYAVENSAKEAMVALLHSGADSSILNNDQFGAIHIATQLNRIEILEEMVKHKGKVDPALKGKHGRTALHIAAILDHAECVKILLKDNLTCPRIPCENGYYPIHEAARNASANALQAILQFGETVGCNNQSIMSMLDADGNVPLHSAVHAGDIKAVKLCLDSGALISTQQHDLSTPAHLACAQGAIEIVKLMFESQPHEKAKCLAIKDAQNMTPLHHAAMFNHPHLVEYLVLQGARIEAEDKDGRSVLLLAAARAAWKAVLVLLRLGADVHHRDNCSRNILHHIVISGGILDNFTQDIEKNLLKCLINEKDVFGCCPLHYASKDGQWRTIVSLINLGASITVRDARNQSPLHFGCRYGRYYTVKLLLEGPEGHLIINAMDGEGMSPLHISSEYGHTKVVQYLLVKGSLLQRDHRGRTPLHCAASNGYTKTMHQLILVHSHLLDQCDREGNTPLHLAVMNNKADAASLLLSLNCKVKKNLQGMTPMDYALHYKHTDVTVAMVLHSTRGDELICMETKKYHSLTEGLIVNMPEVMTSVLDKGISQSSNTSEDSKSFYVKYDFRILESNNEDSKDEKGPLPFLNLMLENHREELLSHPLCIKYLETKWSSYGMYFHLTILAFYTVFLVCLTYACVCLSTRITYHDDFNETIPEFTYLIRRSNSCSYSMLFFTALIVLIFSVLTIAKEGVVMYQQRKKYARDVVNVVGWVLNVSSILTSIIILCPNFVDPASANIIAATAVFSAWFNYLLYLQRFNSFGIYVVMFLEILSTLLRVLFVFSVLIVAFGLSFYILMSHLRESEKGFYSPSVSMVRVSTMMLGELDFLNTFLRPMITGHKDLHIWRQSVASVSFLIIFAILMPILLMNLLIGLAVGDIDTVRRNASMKRLAMQIQHHTDLERRIPKQMLKYVRKLEVYEYPNKRSGKCRTDVIWWALSKIFGGSSYDRQNLPQWKVPSLHESNGQVASFSEELVQMRRRLREMSRCQLQQMQLIRLMAQRMEIQTDDIADYYGFDCDKDEPGDSNAFPSFLRRTSTVDTSF